MQTGNNLSREERLLGSGGMLITLTLTFQFLIGQNVASGETRVNSFQESHGDQRLTYKVTEESSCAGGREGHPFSSPDPLGFIYHVTKRNDRLWGREWVTS